MLNSSAPHAVPAAQATLYCCHHGSVCACWPVGKRTRACCESAGVARPQEGLIRGLDTHSMDFRSASAASALVLLCANVYALISVIQN